MESHIVEDNNKILPFDKKVAPLERNIIRCQISLCKVKHLADLTKVAS